MSSPNTTNPAPNGSQSQSGKKPTATKKVKIIGFSCVKFRSPEPGVFQNDARPMQIDSANVPNPPKSTRGVQFEQTDTTSRSSSATSKTKELPSSHKYNHGKMSPKTPLGKGKSSYKNRSKNQPNLEDGTTASNRNTGIGNPTESETETTDDVTNAAMSRPPALMHWDKVTQKKVTINVVKKLLGIHPSRFGMDTGPLAYDDYEQLVNDCDDHSTFEKSVSSISGTSLSARRVVEKKYGVSVWDSIPAKDCDVVLVFPVHANTDTLTWLHCCLKENLPVLITDLRYHPTARFHAFCLTECYDDLLKGAEEMGIRKPLRRMYGGGITEFVYAERHRFSGIEQPAYFLTSQERQSIVRHTLFKLRSDGTDVIQNFQFIMGQPIIPFLLANSIIKQILPLHDIQEIQYLRANWVRSSYGQKQPLDAICSYFGVKIAMYFAYLKHYTYALAIPGTVGFLCWAVSGTSQLLDDICFVGFALVNFMWSVLYLESWKRRCATYAYRWGTIDVKDEFLVEPRPLFYGDLRLSPVTGQLEFYYPPWKRVMFRCFVTFPMMTLSLCVVFFVTWVNLEFQTSSRGVPPIVFSLDVGNITTIMNAYLPKFILAFSVVVCGEVYKSLAYWLNNKENHRDDESYERNMTIKIVLFESVNSFLALFYIGFYLHDVEQLQQQLAMLLITRQLLANVQAVVIPFIMGRLHMFGIIVTASSHMDMSERMHFLRGAFLRMCQVYLDQKQANVKADLDSEYSDEDIRSTLSDSSSAIDVFQKFQSRGMDDIIDHMLTAQEQLTDFTDLTGTLQTMITGEEIIHEMTQHYNPDITTLTQIEVESNMQWCEGPFEDHLKMFIQFGYVTVFSSAYPTAALWALLDNIIDMRVGSTKYCLAYQRPFGHRVATIGTWQSALEVLSMMSIISNCILIGMSDFGSRLFPNLQIYERIFAMIMFEHVILAVWLGISLLTPNVPVWVAEEKARLEHRRREALKKLNKMTHSRIGLSVADKRHIVEDQHNTSSRDGTVSSTSTISNSLPSAVRTGQINSDAVAGSSTEKPSGHELTSDNLKNCHKLTHRQTS